MKLNLPPQLLHLISFSFNAQLTNESATSMIVADNI